MINKKGGFSMAYFNDVAFEAEHPFWYKIHYNFTKPILIPIIYSIIYLIFNFFLFNLLYSFISNKTNWLTSDYHTNPNSNSLQFELNEGNNTYIVPVDETLFYLKTILLTILIVYILLKYIQKFYTFESHIATIKLIVSFLFGIVTLTTFIFLENYSEPEPQLSVSYSDIEAKKDPIPVYTNYLPLQNVYKDNFKGKILVYFQDVEHQKSFKKIVTIGGTSLFQLSIMEIKNNRKTKNTKKEPK